VLGGCQRGADEQAITPQLPISPDDATVVVRVRGIDFARYGSMSTLPLGRRVSILEEKMAALDGVPARMDALELQMSQFRGEVRAEFTATRAELRDEIRAGDEATRTLIHGVAAGLRGEIQAGDEETRRQITAGDEETRTLIHDVAARLRGEIQGGDEETRRYMRVLHEDVITRIATLGERRPARKRR
jgi:hypothetical protein